MKEYLVLFRGGLDFSKLSTEQLQQSMGYWQKWVEELVNKGVYGGGERLTRDVATAVKGGTKQIIAGPYTSNNEMVGGYITIKAKNLQEAIEITKGCPIFKFDGNAEIREIAKM
jgi:hypothetical protein